MFLLLSHELLFSNVIISTFIDVLLLAAVVLGYLNAGNLFLLVDDLLLHPVLLLNSDHVVTLFLLVLGLHDLSLLGFLMLAQFDGLLDFRFLINTLALDKVVLLRNVTLDILFNLRFINSFSESVLIASLEAKNITSLLLCLFNLLPRLHLLLFEQSYSVGQKLSVSL